MKNIIYKLTDLGPLQLPSTPPKHVLHQVFTSSCQYVICVSTSLIH